jgi:phosphomannomutase/phosphoglucomutase
MDYNGMKLVREGARPISGDSGLNDIEQLAASGQFASAARRGEADIDLDKSAYIRCLLSYVDVAALRPLKIVVNAGNGGAGLVIDALAPHLPFEFVCVHHKPDGSFPNGIPNPLLPENRTVTAEAVREHRADLGIAWDGDFDRCFFFDAQGRFIEGYYLVGLLAAQILEKNPGAKVVHDPRLTWNTIDMVKTAGGQSVMSKTGHAFIKERMRNEDAVYGGEMSAHHYFRDFAYCDSGMIPWLLVAERMSRTRASLAQMVEERMRAYPCSGEINFSVEDTHQTIEHVVKAVAGGAIAIDYTDGVSVEFDDWRFNLRGSNTEPLLRLNVESRENAVVMQDRAAQLSALILGQ